MYNVDKLPHAELHLHRSVVAGYAKELHDFQARLSVMHAYLEESNLLGVLFKNAFYEADIDTIANLFAMLTEQIEKQQQAPTPTASE